MTEANSCEPRTVAASRLTGSPAVPEPIVSARTPDILKRTPLFDAHLRSGAKLTDFGGWELPIQFDSISREHHAVRKAAGLFDISHMGELGVMGQGAPDFLNRMLTNDVGRLGVGEGQYSLLCNERGGVIDDLYVFRLGELEFLLIVNATRIEADLAWLQAHLHDAVCTGMTDLMDLSEVFGAVALQGPRAAEIVDACFSGPSVRAAGVERASDLRKNEIGVFASRRRVYVSRTGYTGEDGFEIMALADEMPAIWNLILERGRALGCRPAGLGARDTLRTEACYPLYGHELTEEYTPIEAGLGFFVALQKEEFIGRDTLLRQKQSGVSKKLVAFEMRGNTAPPRPDYRVCRSGITVGKVTSGTSSPSLGWGIGLAYLPAELARPGTEIEIDIRGRHCPAVVAKKPFYRKEAFRPAAAVRLFERKAQVA